MKKPFAAPTGLAVPCMGTQHLRAGLYCGAPAALFGRHCENAGPREFLAPPQKPRS